MKPTGKENQPRARDPQRPAYVNNYWEKYNQLHGCRYAYASPNTVSNRTYSPLQNTRTYRPHSNMTPTFTPHNQPMSFNIKRENVKPTATKVIIEHDEPTEGGVEIVDFHETWLKEVERINLKKVSSEHKQNDARVQRTRISSHSHGRQNSKQYHQHYYGKRLQSSVVQNKTQNNFTALVNAAHMYSGTTPAAKSAIKMNNFPKTVYGNTKSKPMVPFKRSTQNNAGITTTKANGYVHNVSQLPSHAKRMHSNLEVTQKQQSSNSQKSPYRHLSSKMQLSRNRVIVNQFHASHLLSANNNDKRKILAQNGLTQNAASDYASKLYDTALKQSSPPARAPTLLPIGGSNLRQEPLPGSDDPCTAIDELHDDSESTDDEEEYACDPFYLPDENKEETQQSKCIRFQPERESVFATSDDEEEEQPMYYKPKSILQPSLFPNVPAYLNFSCHIYKGPTMPPALHKILKWKLSSITPKIVKRIVLNSGFRIIKNTTDWMAVWERHMQSAGFRTIRSHQKYNHMPGSFRIGRKDTMWRCIKHSVKKYGGSKFGFMQKTYIMPEDFERLRKAWPKNVALDSKWIVKPPASARGTGIRIINKWSQFPKDRPVVVQKYIEKPLLINDNKFDLRIYVLVTSVNPLRIYMYKDGLARFAAEKYSPELDRMGEKCMHLTNYSINKFSENYTKNEDFNLCQGHKWTLQSLWSCLEARKVNTKRLWATLRDLVIKAIISGESALNRMYRQNVNFRYNCFEVFGFDILLDENIVPWLLEVNISPSMHSELPLDLHVKGPLLQAVLNTTLYQIPPKLNEKMQEELCQELNLSGPLCYDKRLFTTCLTADEVRKHNQFTQRSVKSREDYIDTILDHLLPDDIRCLVLSEDEYARCNPMERIFPTVDTFKYLKFFENPRYYNRLMDAWETKYGSNRNAGLNVLRSLCMAKRHLEVPETANEKEPNVTLTDIDILNIRKDDDIPATFNDFTKSRF